MSNFEDQAYDACQSEWREAVDQEAKDAQRDSYCYSAAHPFTDQESTFMEAYISGALWAQAKLSVELAEAEKRGAERGWDEGFRAGHAADHDPMWWPDNPYDT